MSEQVSADGCDPSGSPTLSGHHPPQTALPDEPVHGTGHTATGYEDGLVIEILKQPHYKTIPSLDESWHDPHDRPACKGPR